MHLNNNYCIFKMEGPMGVFFIVVGGGLLFFLFVCLFVCLFVSLFFGFFLGFFVFFFCVFFFFLGGGGVFGFVYLNKKDHSTILILFRRPFSGTLATVKDK